MFIVHYNNKQKGIIKRVRSSVALFVIQSLIVENETLQQLRLTNMVSCIWIMMLLTVLISRGISQPNPYVDQDHIKQYPYCGIIANSPSGRW